MWCDFCQIENQSDKNRVENRRPQWAATKQIVFILSQFIHQTCKVIEQFSIIHFLMDLTIG